MSQYALTLLLCLQDGVDLTVRCLQSVVATMPANLSFELVIVDDGTADGTGAFLRQLGGDVRVVRHEKRRGRARSFNEAAGLATAPWLLLLRQDVVLTAGFLEPLMTALEQEAGLAAVQPRALRSDGRLADGGGELGREGTARQRGQGHPAPQDVSLRTPRTPDFVTTSSLLIRKEAFLAVGGFDDVYGDGLYGDAHLTFALREAGWEVGYEPHSTIIRDGMGDRSGFSRFASRFADSLAARAARLPPRPRAVAFFLPQFHPIPENDSWWGPGFTEWSNVVRARPSFDGHHQPHLPGELGFYDLRLPEVREQQATLAKMHGVDAFCYYHYWFSGRLLLERPLEDLLSRGAPDFPFCLCWANEDWRSNWDGRTGTVLAMQSHSESDDRAHAHWLMRFFRDARYVRVDGKPLFLIYKAHKLPDPAKTTAILREEARRSGIGELMLCRVASVGEEHGDPRPLGFDAAVEFQPEWHRMGTPSPKHDPNHVFDYADIVRRALDKPEVDWRRYPCVMPGWDNTPRRRTGAVILSGSSPELYRDWLATVTERELGRGPGDKLVFVNAWNEWAEGAHLEPCERFGRAFLEAHREGIGEAGPPPPRLAVRARIDAYARVAHEIEQQVFAFVASGNHEAALREATIACDFAWRNHTGRFASPGIENLLAAIARQVMTDADPSEPSDPGDILHVLSEAHSVGGHTRLAWRWMRAHRGVRHSVALTTSRGRVPDALIEAVRASGGTIHRLAESGSSLLDVARKLRALALSAGLVVLHIHPYDATAVLALSNRTRGPKTIFVNHADHVFWVGVGAADVVANVRPVGESLCVERRGIEPSRMALLPVPIDAPDRKLDRAEAKRELGLAHDAPLFLTVANAYKLEPLDGLGYLDLLPTIMARVPRAELVVVGADENERWKNASGRAGGRIRAVGFREDLQRFQAAADVYVDSYPVSSLTSFLESARFGMPVVRAQLGPRETNIFDVDDHFLDPHVLVGRSVDELVAILNALVDDPSACVRRGEMSARAIIDGHGPEAWSRQLELVIARAAEVGPAEIAPIWRRPNIDALDEHILMLHAGTDMSQSLETLRIFHR